MTPSHEVALWAGVTAFCVNIVGLELVELVSRNEWVRFAASVVVSAIVGVAVYSRERLADARRKQP